MRAFFACSIGCVLAADIVGLACAGPRSADKPPRLEFPRAQIHGPDYFRAQYHVAEILQHVKTKPYNRVYNMFDLFVTCLS